MTPEEKTDAELVAGALKDRNTFAALVERYEKPLERYIRRMGADPELTKDILQESFVRTYLNLNDYDSSLSFSAWIYRIAHNQAISHFRKQKIRPAPVEREEDLALFDSIPDELDIEVESHAKSARAAVQQAIQSLETRYKEVLVLRFFEEKSYDEISDILQVPAGTVATYINRGKARLKELLKKDRTLDV